MELWKSLAFMGYPDYEISNTGRCLGPLGILQGHTNREKCVFTLCNKLGARKFALHRLVAICFIPNPNNLPYVRRYLRDPRNNRATNLYWSAKPATPQAKITKEQAAYIRQVYIKGDRKYGQVALAVRFGISTQIIQNLLRGKTWKD